MFIFSIFYEFILCRIPHSTLGYDIPVFNRNKDSYWKAKGEVDSKWLLKGINLVTRQEYYYLELDKK